jgi:hypothetical protein
MASMDPSSFQILMQIVNDSRSWFGSPEFQYTAVETRNPKEADWLVAIESEANLKKISFGGLSVT